MPRAARRTRSLALSRPSRCAGIGELCRDLTKAATAQPGEVLRRAAGSRAALAKLKPAKAAAKPKGPSKAALKKIAELETRLEAVDAARERDLAALETQREALVARHAKARARLEAQLTAARRARG